MGLVDVTRGLGYQPFESNPFVWHLSVDGADRFMSWKQGYVASPYEAARIVSDSARLVLSYRALEPAVERSPRGDERSSMALGFAGDLPIATLERIAQGRYEDTFAQLVETLHASYHLVPGRFYRFELIEVSSNDPVADSLTSERVFNLFPERLGRALNLSDHEVSPEPYETAHLYGSFGMALDHRGIRGTSEDVMLAELFSRSPNGVIIPAAGFDIKADLLDRAIEFGPRGPLADRIVLESEHLRGELARELYREHPFATTELDGPVFAAALKRFRAHIGTN